MLKKQLLSLMLLVMAVATASAGTWITHNYYMSTKINNVFDTGDKIYYVNCNKLFMFDKVASTTAALNQQNMLTGGLVSQIYYDWESGLLFVAYLDTNIDIIDSDGKVYNVSNIKNLVMNVRNQKIEAGELKSFTGKTINDITFANGLAYVAVGYGYATIDEATKKVVGNVDFGNGININSVAVMGNRMVILANDTCYYGPMGSTNPLREYSKSAGAFSGSKMYPINASSVFVLGSTALYNYDFSGTAPVLTSLVAAKSTSVQKTTTGFIANFAGQNFYYTIDPTGKTATKASSSIGFATSDPNGDGTVWINDGNGLHMKNSATNYKVNALTTDEPYWLKYNATMDKLYVGTSALNQKNRTLPSNMAPHVINIYDGTNWQNATAYSATGAGYEFVFAPFDSTTYVRASWDKGIHKVKNNVLVATYNSNNSLVGTYKAHPAFDKNGNLWVVNSFGYDNCPVSVLPRDKFNLTPAKTNWVQPPGLTSLYTLYFQASRFIISKKNNYKIYCDGDNANDTWVGHILCWDNGSDDVMAGNYRIANISNFVNQNNQLIEWSYLFHMEEDNDGMIWVGYMGGLFVFDPDVVFDDNPRATRPFVTNFDEGKGYLCDGFFVYDVGVTRDNKKWIATNNGVYYVSPDGTEVYNHFTIDNSDIPSNLVYSIECDTVHNRVYIFTDNGFAEYVANGDAAAVNFDGTYAFPNPVEPDFTGMVKIDKLMTNSYVTITDRNGQVVAQLGPVMGSALWDCSGPDGNRVPTGVYNVYAAQGRQPSLTGTPQTTIMVIR